MASGLPTAIFGIHHGVVCDPKRRRAALAASPDRVETEIDGRHLTLSNLEKILYPDTGFTKAAMLDYYARIAAVMVPHLERRPLTLRRYPDGVAGPSFFAKNVPAGAPSWVQTVTVASVSGRASRDESGATASVRHVVCGDRP